MSDHGFIALGKYSSARDSILHFLCQSEWSNGSFGDVEAPTGFVYRITVEESDVHGNPEFDSVIEEWFEQNPEVTDSYALRQELVGFWLVNEDSNGFSTTMDGQTEKTQKEIFYSLRDKYEQWETSVVGEDED
jgi:hypothetical protein